MGVELPQGRSQTFHKQISIMGVEFPCPKHEVSNFTLKAFQLEQSLPEAGVKLPRAAFQTSLSSFFIGLELPRGWINLLILNGFSMVGWNFLDQATM